MHKAEGFTRSGSWGLARASGSWAFDGRKPAPGRELERLRLINALDAVLLDSSPSLVTISAPARMGKSRLIAETVELARDSGFEGRIYAAGALPGDGEGALVARLLRQRLGPDLTDLPETRAWCELFVADANLAPLCLVVEDLHHADGASLAALDTLLPSLAGPALILGSAWPGFFERQPFPRVFRARRDHLDLTSPEP